MVRLLLIAVVCSLLTGCSSGPPPEPAVAVRGRLTNGGQPLAVAGREVGTGFVELKFLPLGPEGKVGTAFFQASVDDQGYYTVPGRQNVGLPPGKYRVVVRQWEPYPQTDKLGGKFDEQNSKLERTLDAPGVFDIDLAQP
jgi:hypothetical protein